MKRFALLVMMVVWVVFAQGCAGRYGKAAQPDRQTATVVFRPTDAEAVLSCLSDQRKMTRKEFKAAYAAAHERYAKNKADADARQLICLSLHPYAGNRQFKDGLDQLALYIQNHPDAAPGLQGIQLLMQRIDREKAIRWAQSNKTSDEKEGLESENKELVERNEQLEHAAEQEKNRIGELQKQIEQLKNIENIIKNRER
jgi:uncharacterized protein HemX